MSCPVKKEDINRIRNENEITQNRVANKRFNEIAKEAAIEATAQQPPKTKFTPTHAFTYTRTHSHTHTRTHTSLLRLGHTGNDFIQ